MDPQRSRRERGIGSWVAGRDPAATDARAGIAEEQAASGIDQPQERRVLEVPD
jgi:hypothetical protein